MESSVAVPQKLNIDLAHDPAIPLQDLYSPRLETDVQTETHTWMFKGALFTISKWCEQPKYPERNQWINKLWYTHAMEYYLATKVNEVLVDATMKCLETMMLCCRSQTQNSTYCLTSFIKNIQKGKTTETASWLVVSQGWGETESGWLLMSRVFPFEGMKIFRNLIVPMVVQHCYGPKWQWIVYFKVV